MYSRARILLNCYNPDTMSNLFENNSVSGILDRTPKQEPYYSEVRGSIQKLKLGDISHNPIYGLIHGQVGALLEANKLGSEWSSRRVPGGVIVPHRDFIAIQDEFTQLEGDRADLPKWNAEMSLDAITKYLSTMRKYRERHNAFFTQALPKIPAPQLDIVQNRLKHHQDLLDDKRDFVMVAIPSHFDNQKLWESLGISGDLLKRIGPWSKINEQGVILASRKYRDDNPRGHDYFSYALREVIAGRAKSISEVLSQRTGKHEGSHGITDALFMDLLNIDAYNPVYEGFVGALGEDGREKRYKNTFEEFIGNPSPADSKKRMDNGYYGGAKYWTALKNILEQRGVEIPWVTLIGNGLMLSAELSANKQLMKEEPNKRVFVFLNELPKKLSIDMPDLQKEFDAIN